MKRLLAIAVFTMFIGTVHAQTILVPYSGNSTTTACSGTIQDHAGNSNYSNGANGYLVIDPPGSGTVSVTFSQFATESCCDRVYIYDGVGTSATLIGNYGGYSLPNGGSPITSTGGAITIRFYSDGSVIGAGFTATWSASGGSATPQAALSVSTTNPAFNTPVTFTNTSNFGTTIWLFGDGNTSTDDVATHSYTSSGTYQARLVVENCLGVKDTSNPVNITVQAAPNGSLSTDTVSISVPCGNANSTAFSISNSGTGSLSYNIALEPNVSSQAYRATFENNSLDGFVNQSLLFYNTSFISSGAPQGTDYLQFQGDGNLNDGLRAVFPAKAATTVRYSTKYTSSTSFSGQVEIGEFNNGFNRIFYSLYSWGQLRLYYGNGFGGTYVWYVGNQVDTWYEIELKNIDYSTETYDIYVDGTLLVSNASFINSASSINQIEVFSQNQITMGLDDFYVGDESALNAVTFSPNSGTLANSGNSTIFINVNTTGLNAGTYYLDFVITSNDTALDGMRLPLELIVTGTANLIQSTNSVGYGNVFNTQAFTDSVLIFNSGCDTLNFNSFTSSDVDLTVLSQPFDLPPGDSTYLFYEFAPTQVATYIDSIYLNGPDTNSFVQVTAQVAGAPIISTNPSSYNLTVNGCPDTVDFDLTILNSGLSALNWGATAAINGVNTDDFEASTINTNLWSNWSSGLSVGSSCGVISGSQSLIFNGSGTRYIETVPMNATGGGNIQFDYWQSNCEFADNGEGLYVFYSLNNGISWVQMGYFYTTLTSTFTATVPIPLAAQTNGVKFKIQQSFNSGSSFDYWVIDDFSVSSSFNNSVIFTPDTGAVSANDSVQVLGQIITTGLVSGTYNFPIYINSNDPANGLISIPVTLTINGAPGIDLPSACLQDTAVVYTTVIDSAMVINDGCADLTISNVVTSTSSYSPTTTSLTVMPGDTGYLVYSFAPLNTGQYADSLQLSSNASSASICLAGYALGAPEIDVDSTLISVTLNSCSDSSVVSLAIKNTGAGVLDYKFLGQGNDTIKILAVTTGYGYSNYLNSLNALSTYMTKPYTISTVFATNATTLANALQDIDILWIPPLASQYYSTYTAMAPAAQSFVSDGGKMVCTGTGWTSNIRNLGIFVAPATPNQDFGFQSLSLGSQFANHPAVQGISSSPVSADRTYYYNVTNAGARKFLKRTNNSSLNAITEIDYGSGEAIWLGFNWASTNNDVDRILANVMEDYGTGYGAYADWLVIDPDSGSVVANDSIIVDLTFKSNGVGSGTYIDTLVIETNDPLNPFVRIPIQLTINGNADISVDQNCVSFDSTFVGLTKNVATSIYNPACDTLVIDSTYALSNNFTLLGLPVSVPPYDSVQVNLGFTPDTIGYVQDTLFLFSNANTTPGICVTGYGMGAPAVSPAVDTIRVTLNKCDGFIQVPFVFNNGGNGLLNYQLSERSVYRETSIQNYTTTYATTSHTFTNTPSTADTIFFMCVVNGDFNSDFGGEFYTFRSENYFIPIYDNNAPDGTNDTSYGFYTGTLINNWLSDNQLDVTVQNGYGVGLNVGQDMHLVEVRIESIPSWMTIISSKTGTLNTGASTSKTVLFNANGLNVGSYNSSILVESNDPVNPVYTVYVELEVVDKPTMEIPNNCINYGAINGTTPVTDSVLVVNSGCKNLVINTLQFANPVFSSPLSSLTIPAKDSAWIPVTLTPTQAAVLNSNMLIFSNDTNLSVCLTATVSLSPIANFDYQVIDACEGEVDFTDLSTNTPNQWQWDFGDGQTSFQQNPKHFFEKPGTYTVSLYASNNGGTDTSFRVIDMTKVLYVNFSMPDTIRAGVPAQFYDSSQVATSWQWFFGDGGNSSIQNPTHTYNLPGTYFLTLIASNPDCNIQVNRQVVVRSGIGLDELEVASIRVYPNPTSNQITAEWSATEKYKFVSVVDMTGKTLMRVALQNESKVSLAVDDLADGIYFLKFEDKTGSTELKRFVVRH
jgi:hypothetical protein